MVLVTAMILLLVLTVLSISMFQNFGLLERITGNSREKIRSFHAAQSTLIYAETLLPAWTGTVTTCGSSVQTQSGTQPVICGGSGESAMTTATLSGGSWTTGTNYTPAPPSPPALNGVTPSGWTVTTASTTAGTGVTGYASTPMYYIFPLGNDTTGKVPVFQVNAVATGGNSNAQTVLQSTYVVKSKYRDAGSL